MSTAEREHWEGSAPAAAIGSMVVFQSAMALTVPLLLALGPSAATWLRLIGASAVLWIVARPRYEELSRRAILIAGLLGVATCGMAVFYAEAIARIPLGMTTAIQFLGPLGVAVAASSGLRSAMWAALAGLGVVLLALTRSGWSVDPVGIGFALGAAAAWAGYILLTKRVGQAFAGLGGLTVSLTVAAMVATPVGLITLKDGASGWAMAASAVLGVLVPVVPYGLEMLALRRMTPRAFGVLMSLDPAISTLAGFLLLHQAISAQRAVGILCVVAASVGASLRGTANS